MYKGGFHQIKALSSDLDVVHYHAHSTSQPGDPLTQALEFEDGPLIVKEYLDVVPRSKGHHITLLGCSSGVTVQTTSNEPLGLVPALMHHGAASIVSALWAIDDKDAASFSDTFYDSYGDPSSSSNNEVGEATTQSKIEEVIQQNKETDQTNSIEDPLPPGWEMRQSADNQTHFVDHKNGTVTEIDPRLLPDGLAQIPLPPGWKIQLTANNRFYLGDSDTSMRAQDDQQTSKAAPQNIKNASVSEIPYSHTRQKSPSTSKVINIALATQRAILHLMRQPSNQSRDTLAEEEAIGDDPAATEDVRLKNDPVRAPLRSWAGFVLNGWWIMSDALSQIPPSVNISPDGPGHP